MPSPHPSATVPHFSDRSRSRFSLLFGICFAAAFAGSWHLAQIQPALLFEAEGRRNMARFTAGMFPPELSPEFLRLLVLPLLQTIQISVMGIVLAVAIGVPLGVLGTASLTHTGILNELEMTDSAWRRIGRTTP